MNTIKKNKFNCQESIPCKEHNYNRDQFQTLQKYIGNRFKIWNTLKLKIENLLRLSLLISACLDLQNHKEKLLFRNTLKNNSI